MTYLTKRRLATEGSRNGKDSALPRNLRSPVFLTVRLSLARYHMQRLGPFMRLLTRPRTLFARISAVLVTGNLNLLRYDEEQSTTVL
jgi:hypothetical protein